MERPYPLPNPGEVFFDVRGEDRTLRVSHHPEAGVTVVSLWAGRSCRGSFRVATQDVPRLARLFEQIAGAGADDGRAPGPVAEAS
jgi:hypothetical protein